MTSVIVMIVVCGVHKAMCVDVMGFFCECDIPVIAVIKVIASVNCYSPQIEGYTKSRKIGKS